MSVSEDGSYHMGVLAGTVTGEYEAGYLGSKARERHRLAKIEECKNLILVLEEKIAGLERERNNLSERKDRLKSEYDALPGDTDLREAMKLLLAEEQKYELLRSENEKTGEQLAAFLEEIKEKKRVRLRSLKNCISTVLMRRSRVQKVQRRNMTKIW